MEHHEERKAQLERERHVKTISSSKHMERLKKKKTEVYNTCGSQAVTHPSTEQAQQCLLPLNSWKAASIYRLGSKFREKQGHSTHVTLVTFTVCIYIAVFMCICAVFGQSESSPVQSSPAIVYTCSRYQHSFWCIHSYSVSGCEIHY